MTWPWLQDKRGFSFAALVSGEGTRAERGQRPRELASPCLLFHFTAGFREHSGWVDDASRIRSSSRAFCSNSWL